MLRWLIPALLSCTFLLILPIWMLGLPGNGFSYGYGMEWKRGLNALLATPLVIAGIVVGYSVHVSRYPNLRASVGGVLYALAANIVAVVGAALFYTILQRVLAY